MKKNKSDDLTSTPAASRCSEWLGELFSNLSEFLEEQLNDFLSCFRFRATKLSLKTFVPGFIIFHTLQCVTCLAVVIPQITQISPSWLSEKRSKPEYSLLNSRNTFLIKSPVIGMAVKLTNKLGECYKEVVFGVASTLVNKENQPADTRKKRPYHQPTGFLEGCIYIFSIFFGLFLSFHVFEAWRKWQYGWTPNDKAEPSRTDAKR